jgi:hypothetical protein
MLAKSSNNAFNTCIMANEQVSQNKYHGDVEAVIKQAGRVQEADGAASAEANIAMQHVAEVRAKVTALETALREAEQHRKGKLVPAQQVVAQEVKGLQGIFATTVERTGNHPAMAAAATALGHVVEMTSTRDNCLNNLTGPMYDTDLTVMGNQVNVFTEGPQASLPATETLVASMPPAYTQHVGAAQLMVQQLGAYVSTS